MNASHLLVVALLILAGGAVLAGLLAKARPVCGRVGVAATGVAGCLALIAAAAVLVRGATAPVTLLDLGEYGGMVRISVDGLSAIFLGLIAVVSTLAALYSLEYLEHTPEYGLARYWPAFLLFLAGMYGIVTVTDLMLGFFICWQFMTLASFALVRFEHRKVECRRAATRYLIAMEIACALVLLGAALLGSGPIRLPGGELLGAYEFDALSHGVPALLAGRQGLLTAALLLFLTGFGLKAGMWPFGTLWLPQAHPAAPSPVSALLSGVMIKTGVYGLMRSFFWLIPASAAAGYRSDLWGLVLVGFGTVTLLLGTLQALGQNQTKRLLAFSSIGQVGYILFGLGASLALLPRGPANQAALLLAALAFAGALFHTVNHGVFKSLLFLNAGALLGATGTQELNQLGGLAKRMPVTAATALVGSLAIAGVPLLNGFASKWTLFSAAVLGSRYTGYLGFAALLAVLTSVLTLAVFLKFFGTSFLGRTSAWVRERAGDAGRLEVGFAMRLPQIVLAAGCVALGLVPSLPLRLIGRALFQSRQGLGEPLAEAAVGSLAGRFGIAGPAGLALLVPLALLLAVAGLFALVAWASGLGHAERRGVIPWFCGYALESEENRYGARNLYREVTRHLGWIGGAPPAVAEDRAAAGPAGRGGK